MAKASLQPGPFQEIRSYDFPNIALTQLLEGEASWGSFRRLMFDRPALSPAERNSYVEDLKKLTGNTSAGNALVDVVTNPLVWLGFLFSPAGASAARPGARLFVEWGQKNPMLAKVLQTGWQFLDNTAGGSALSDISKSTHDLALEWRTMTEVQQNALLRQLGMDPKHGWEVGRLSDPKARRHAERVLKALHISLYGAHREVAHGITEWAPNFYVRADPLAVNREGEYIGTYLKVGEEERRRLWEQFKDIINKMGGGPMETKEGFVKGTKAMRTADGQPVYIGRPDKGGWSTLPGGDDIERPIVASIDGMGVDDWLKSVPGAWAYRQALQSALRQRFKHLFLKDPEVPEKVMLNAAREGRLGELLDPEKLQRLWLALTGTDEISRTFQRQLGDRDFINLLLTRSTRRAMLSGKLKYQEFLDAVTEGFSSSVHLDNYVPRNINKWYTAKYPGGGRPPEIVELEPHQMPGTLWASDPVVTSSGRSKPIEVVENPWDPRELSGLEDLGFQLTRHGERMRRGGERMLNVLLGRTAPTRAAEGKPMQVFRSMDLPRALVRYQQQSAKDYSLFVLQPSAETIALQRKLNPHLPTMKSWIAPREYHPEAKFQADIGRAVMDPSIPRNPKLPETMRPAGGWSNAWVLEQTALQLGDPQSQKLLRETLLPAALGTLRHEHKYMEAAVGLSQAAARRFANSRLGLRMESLNEGGKEFIHRLRFFGDQDPNRYVSRWMANAAGYLYSSHLGVNLGSVILNLQQPWLHLSNYVGADNTLKAYGDAFRDMIRYSKVRWREFPQARITPAQRREIIEGKYGVTFEFPDETNILGHVLEDLDTLAMDAETIGGKGGLGRWLLQDLPLKGFEKAEWFNRLVAVHATKYHHLKTGTLLRQADGSLVEGVEGGMTAFRADAERMVQETQFGADFLNTPLAFMSNPWLANPLIRQFATFTLRAPLAYLAVGPRVGGGKRQFGFQKLGGPILWENAPWWLGDSARALGISATIYEVGKNLLGVDLSRGGATSAFFDVVGGDRFMEPGETPSILTPPAAAILIDFGRGVLKAESQFIGSALARLIPGGVSLQRLLGIAPPLGQGSDNPLARLGPVFQKRWADWGNPTPDGLIPLYRADGSLMEFKSGLDLVLGGLGVDSSKLRTSGDTVHWMSRNRDEILRYRSEALNALLSNNPGKAIRLKKEFEKRFGVPLTFSQRQLRARLRVRTVPAAERMADSMAPELRQQYLEYLRANPQSSNLPPEAFDLPTSGARTRQHIRHTGDQLDPESIRVLREMMEKERASRPPSQASPAFTSYPAY